jgi:hypothetical protein
MKEVGAATNNLGLLLLRVCVYLPPRFLETVYVQRRLVEVEGLLVEVEGCSRLDRKRGKAGS